LQEENTTHETISSLTISAGYGPFFALNYLLFFLFGIQSLSLIRTYKMPQKFWASSEDLSVDSSVDSSTYTGQKGPENGSSDGAQDNNALVRTTVGSMSLPNLPANQHASLFYLSLIEDRCKTQAVKTINATRRQEDCLPADHPEVCDLAKHLFIETRRDLLKAGIIPKELASKSLPDLQLYLRSFDALLNNIATRKNSDISIQQDYRAIDGLSLPLNRDLSASIEFSRALVRHDSSINLSMAEQQVDPSLLSLLSLKGPIDIAQQSTYSRDFTEYVLPVSLLFTPSSNS
jgi:hypothetical protein